MSQTGSEFIYTIDKVWFASLGLNQDMLAVFFGLLLCTTLAWIYLSRRLYRELKQNEETVFEIPDKSRSFLHRNRRVNLSVIMFLLKKEDEATGNQSIIRLCHGLRLLFGLYLFFLGGCVVLVIARAGWI